MEPLGRHCAVVLPNLATLLHSLKVDRHQFADGRSDLRALAVGVTHVA
jgi:hypothetical protein